MHERMNESEPRPLEAASSGSIGMAKRAVPPDPTRESELAMRARSGDDEAFLTLMANARDSMLRISLAYLRSEDAALEAIQETTCRAYAKLRKLREPAYFRTWLIRILMNVCADEQKRLRRQRPSSALPERIASGDNPGEDWMIEDAIAGLPPKLRQIVILKYVEDMTLSDIARWLKRPEGTVKTWLNKALVALRKQAGKEEARDGRGTTGWVRAADREADRL
ncbi:sigma-70 family RNA polymerase sigma factor [Cohnella sp. 56]|uniref:sigma-70 family RNA polymerase sigma factor n=1 Tax=Cohnella sp. 56 TaxID=3113722 RepID=UPI0030E7B72C